MICRVLGPALLLACAFVPSARAQDKPIELGVDGLFALKVNDPTATVLTLPVQRFRIGFPASDRLTVEPAFHVNYFSVGGESAKEFGGELGLLYHFSANSKSSQVFVHPVVGVQIVADGSTETRFGAGAGIGVKVPAGSRLAARLEAAYFHGFKGSAGAASDEIRLSIGLSFFTR